jgi:NADH:ubiquinone oxidoreductase subunit 5 (subunit L)/multisubunit Na+/H+ antiporter MnhA subunit
MIGSTIIAIPILYSHLIIYYDVVTTINSLGNIVSSCTSQNNIYNTFFGIWHMTFYSLCPSFLMLLFGSLTMRNIQRQRQAVPMVGGNNRGGRRTNTQLLRMLAAQVLVIILSTLPFSGARLYFLFTANIVKSSFQQTQDSLASAVIVTIPYFAHTSSFYLYTLTGSVFHKEFFKIISYCLPHNRNPVRVHHIKTNQISASQNNPQVPNNRNIPTQQ